MPHAPDTPDTQVHVNHATCSAGVDSKRRLYIKRCEDGYTIVAYCHHCGKRGSVSKRKYKFGSTEKKCEGVSVSERPQFPCDCSGSITTWPTAAKVWVRQYGITNKEVEDYGLCYSEDVQRVLIPVYEEEDVVLWQSRKVFPEDTRPKYITTHTRSGGVIWRSLNWDVAGTCIICEDVLSAIKCSRVLPSVTTLGVHINDKCLNFLVENYTNFIIFYDDDNPAVRRQQLILKNKLAPFGSVTIIHNNGVDPKELSTKQLQEVLLC